MLSATMHIIGEQIVNMMLMVSISELQIPQNNLDLVFLNRLRKRNAITTSTMVKPILDKKKKALTPAIIQKYYKE